MVEEAAGGAGAWGGAPVVRAYRGGALVVQLIRGPGRSPVGR
jgi:hypothetical protein